MISAWESLVLPFYPFQNVVLYVLVSRYKKEEIFEQQIEEVEFFRSQRSNISCYTIVKSRTPLFTYPFNSLFHLKQSNIFNFCIAKMGDFCILPSQYPSSVSHLDYILRSHLFWYIFKFSWLKNKRLFQWLIRFCLFKLFIQIVQISSNWNWCLSMLLTNTTLN